MVRGKYKVSRLPHSVVTYVPVLAGRPEKLPDVCYSWWVLASIKMIGKLHWISKVHHVTSPVTPSDIFPHTQEKLTKFILACQDSETGGFTDRPGDWVSLPCEDVHAQPPLCVVLHCSGGPLPHTVWLSWPVPPWQPATQACQPSPLHARRDTGQNWTQDKTVDMTTDKQDYSECAGVHCPLVLFFIILKLITFLFTPVFCLMPGSLAFDLCVLFCSGPLAFDLCPLSLISARLCVLLAGGVACVGVVSE